MTDEPTNLHLLDQAPLLRFPSDDEKTLPCPECGQMCKDSTGLGVHRSVKHGYKGNKKTRKKRKVVAAGERVLASGSIPRQPVKPDWSTREVFDSVVSLLWPGDTMPVAALPILLDWKDDTERMLHRLEALP